MRSDLVGQELSEIALDEGDFSRVTTGIIICSFYSNDDYHKAHAQRLRGNLDELGIAYDLREVIKNPGEDLAITFSARVLKEKIEEVDRAIRESLERFRK